MAVGLLGTPQGGLTSIFGACNVKEMDRVSLRVVQGAVVVWIIFLFLLNKRHIYISCHALYHSVTQK